MTGNDTHWVVRSVDAGTGATVRELCSWPQVLKNAFYHNTQIDQQKGILYVDVGRMLPSDTLYAVDLTTGKKTPAWPEFNVLSFLSRLTFDSGPNPGFYATSIFEVTETHKLARLDIANKSKTVLGVMGTSSWMLQQCSALLPGPSDRAWVQFVSAGTSFFVTTHSLKDASLVSKAPWTGAQDAMMYAMMPRPLKVKPLH